MGTKRAALYLRQSLDRAEGIESQKQRCTALAGARGWQIIDTFVDNETKASEVRGPETDWGRMLPRIGKDFEIVVSVDLDRLARNTRDLNQLIDLGAAVVTVDGEIDLASAEGEFRGTMITAIARFETRRASERQKRHKAAKAERGEWHGGVPPYGYRAESGKLIPDPSEVALIEEATKRLLERGHSLHSIIVDWNNRGKRTRKGHHWRQTGLRPILLNRSMLGETAAGVRGWEPIIDQRTFDRLTTLLTDPSRKIVHSPGALGGKRSLGGGLAVCGLCKKPLITHSKTTGAGTGTSTATLGCLARVHGPDGVHHPRVCRLSDKRDPERDETGVDTNRVTIAHDALEVYVFETVIAELTDTERWKKRMAEKDPAVDDRLDELDRRRDELTEQRLRAGKAYMMGAYSDRELAAEVARIRADLEAVNSESNELLGRPMINAVLQEGKLENWRDWSPTDRRAFLRLFIERIEVHPYPPGTARTSPRFRNESDEDHAARKWGILKAGCKARTRIVWKWASQAR